MFNSNNANEGYNYFECKLKECFCDSFKLIRLSRKRSKDKRWITPGLKITSRHKK